jgi:hypothetical protein
MRLDASPYDEAHEEPGLNLYQELCPLIPMVLSSQPPAGFARAITDARNPVHAPRIFFADLRLDRDARGKLVGDLPYTDPLHLEDLIHELEHGDSSGKETKTVSRTPRTRGFLRVIRRGFFLGDQTGLKFYRFPTREELEIHHSKWWHSASAQ